MKVMALSIFAGICLSAEGFNHASIYKSQTINRIKSMNKYQMSSFSMVMTANHEAEVKIFEPFGKGIKEDIKRKLPHFVSEFKDGVNIKTVSSVFFLFFACLAPAVAFGGLLGLATGGTMGTMETIAATAIGGVLYAIFSGQPLTIIGTTGPLLAFIKVVFDTCQKNNVPFLPIYSWIGIWSSLVLYFSAFFSTSNLIEYFTKFTDDIFSSLISVIFIYEAVKDLAGNFLNPSISGLSACMSLIVALVTYTTAIKLSAIRKSQFFNRRVRNLLADFAPTIGVASGMAVSFLASQRYGLQLPTLAVPLVLGTTSGRPWLVDIFSISNKMKFLCIIPAIMASVLLFMDQNITTRLMISKANKLKKGSGIHLDMLVVAVVTTITSLLGMPWMVAATVRSLSHLRSLKLYKSVDDPASDTPKLEIVGVQEQRVSGLMIHSLIGASIIYFRKQLRCIPIASLTGLFLYLGLSSISTTELYDRALLFITDQRDIPRGTSWTKNVQLAQTKLFTGIQVLLLGAMWWLKNTRLGVFFPVLVGGLAPIRILLEKFNVFSKDELEALDGEIA
eukprot:gene4271-8499_t